VELAVALRSTDPSPLAVKVRDHAIAAARTAGAAPAIETSDGPIQLI
jgi:hypothetical protein